jgi:hypothetical protein
VGSNLYSFRSLISSLPHPPTHRLGAHFKALPQYCGGAFFQKWGEYVTIWPSLSDELKQLPINKFWKDPRVLSRFTGGKCDELYRIASWWACFPIGNVNIERAFGIMRSIDVPLRRSMSGESMEHTMMALVNAWIVDIILEEQAKLTF